MFIQGGRAPMQGSERFNFRTAYIMLLFSVWNVNSPVYMMPVGYVGEAKMIKTHMDFLESFF